MAGDLPGLAWVGANAVPVQPLPDPGPGPVRPASR